MLGPLVPTILGPLLGIINKIIPDPAAAAAAKLELMKMQSQGELKALDADLQIAVAQNQVNANEAESGSRYDSGWRPLIGWGCAIAFIYHFLIVPFTTDFLSLFGYHFVGTNLAMGPLMTITTGMLGIGMGALRSYDKSSASAAKSLDRQAFYATIVRESKTTLAPAQVTMLNDALNSAEDSNNG